MSYTTLLDFDGVIVDSIEIFADAVNVAGAELNQSVQFVADDLRTIKRMTIAEITDAAGIDERLTRQFITEIDRDLFRRARQIQMFAGMTEVIKRLSSRGRLAIVSASSQLVISKVMQNHGLENFIDDIVGGDTQGTKSSKICSLIRKYQSSANRTCMIGDTVTDLEQGKIAGVSTIAVSWGWHSIDKLRTAQPDFEVYDPASLIQLVETIFATTASPIEAVT